MILVQSWHRLLVSDTVCISNGKYQEKLLDVKVLQRDKCDDSENLQSSDGQLRYKQIVSTLMWIDRPDARCRIGRAAQRLGKARQCDVANFGVLQCIIWQKLQSHVEPVEFPCDICNRAPDQSVLTCVDDDWAGGPDRCSTSGGTAWVKDSEQWYSVWLTLRK